LHSLGACFGFFVIVYAVALLLVSISNYHEATFKTFLLLDSHSYGAMWHLRCKRSEDVFLCMPNITDFWFIE